MSPKHISQVAGFTGLFFVLAAISGVVRHPDTWMALLWLPTVAAAAIDLRTQGRLTLTLAVSLLLGALSWHLVHGLAPGPAAMRALAQLTAFGAFSLLAPACGLHARRLDSAGPFVCSILLFALISVVVGAIFAVPLAHTGAAATATHAFEAWVLGNLGAACLVLPVALTASRRTLRVTLAQREALKLLTAAAFMALLTGLATRFLDYPRLAIVTGLVIAALLLPLLGTAILITVAVVGYGTAAMLVDGGTQWSGLVRGFDLLSTALMISGPMAVALMKNERESTAEELAQAYRRLDEHRRELEDTVRVQTAELRTALSEAQSASVQKTLFLSNASHEMRTPLHAIFGFAQLAIDKIGKGDTQKAVHHVEKIRASSERLMHYVDNILDLAELSAGKVRLTPRPVVLQDLVNSAVAHINDLLHTRSQHTSTTFRAATSTISADRRRLDQLMTNLLVNASQFSPEHSDIAIEVEDARTPDGEPAVRISVQDRGIGIPDAEVERIFSGFYQSSRTASKAGGSGLGLAISREIVALHGGDIRARNVATGGARIEVLLPAALPPDAAID